MNCVRCATLLFSSVLMLLAGCADPQAKGSSSVASAPTGSGGPVVIASPGVAEGMAKSDGPFPMVPAGYRGIGGVFSPQGNRVIVAADMSALQKHDMDVGLLHG